MPTKRIGRQPANISGQRFGRLVAVEYVPQPPSRGKWLCHCDCGYESFVNITQLRDGTSRSCGCWRAEYISQSKIRHGHCANRKEYTPEYTVWRRMKAYCHNPRNRNYADYGGRGIFVCQKWRDSFQAFLDDMGHKPHPNLTLDRTNNDGPYAPGNCRWATYADQLNNRRPCKPRKRPID